ENLAIIKLRFNNWENISYKYNIEKENKLIQMLIEVIRKTLFAGDSLGKWSDNEYIIMVEETKNNNRVNDVIQNILLNINKPLIMDDQCILITANFGISVHPQDGDNIRGLLNKATMALTKSYDKSFNTYQYYSREISSQLMDKKYDFQTLIFKAITEEKFIVKYNPIINVKTNQISGFNSKLFSEEIDLTENEIITLASEIGYTDNLIRLWLEKISQDISFFQENSLPVNKVSLKILLSSLSNIDTVNLLIEIITNPEKNLVNIELEIIIDNYLFDIKIVEENLNKLINISVALSLSNLDINNLITLSHQKVKFTTIKISAFMINELENNSKNLSLIASIINLAKSCKLNLIAEGITTEKQKDILLDLDCQEMEGIFFTPPLLPENIKDFLESNSLSFMSVI
ncbi:MAG: EAL domain-containing protein, partial [Cyanobacteria bacterium]|nr:EAL domain-containing protein [Cyanobacteria bacterium CG_2015-04_32_10]